MKLSKIFLSSTKVVQIMPLWSKLTPPRGSQFYIDLYKENFKQHLLFNRLWDLNKLQRNDPLVVSYQSCSNRSSWLHN